jgi:hypothetical protein
MKRNGKNTVGFKKLYNQNYFLDYEIDSTFIEWYNIEGSEQIIELSRQLRTFLNYKTSLICIRYSSSQNCPNNIKNSSIFKQKNRLISLTSEFISLFKTMGTESGTISEKINTLMDRSKIQRDSLDIKLLKDIKNISVKLWRTLHVLSELQLQNYSELFKISINLATILCSINPVFFPIYSDFYNELKLNYLALEEELAVLLASKFKDQSTIKKNNKRVKII